MSVESQLEFQYQLASFLKDSILRFCKDWEAGERGEFRPPGPARRYVVRADTDLGPVYLRSLTGSCTEWTSELRFAHRFTDQEEVRQHADEAWCPDASRISVRRLRRSLGYHIHMGRLFVISDDPQNPKLYGIGTDKPFRFRSKAAAQRLIDVRVANGFASAELFRIVPVPASPGSAATGGAR